MAEFVRDTIMSMSDENILALAMACDLDLDGPPADAPPPPDHSKQCELSLAAPKRPARRRRSAAMVDCERHVLDAMAAGAQTMGELLAATGMARGTLGGVLRRLREAGAIDQSGATRGARYGIAEASAALGEQEA
jgi:DNA-binding transcriptional ArsR family regulator